jgi:hypothetical protein
LIEFEIRIPVESRSMKPETNTVFKVTIIGSSTAICCSKLLFSISIIEQVSLIRISLQIYNSAQILGFYRNFEIQIVIVINVSLVTKLQYLK